MWAFTLRLAALFHFDQILLLWSECHNNVLHAHYLRKRNSNLLDMLLLEAPVKKRNQSMLPSLTKRENYKQGSLPLETQLYLDVNPTEHGTKEIKICSELLLQEATVHNIEIFSCDSFLQRAGTHNAGAIQVIHDVFGRVWEKLEDND